MAKYEVNGQVYEFPDEMSDADVLNIISTQDPKAFEPTPTTGNPQLDATITQGNQMENSAEYQSPFVGTPMGNRPVSQEQMLDTLGVAKDAPVESAPAEATLTLDANKPYGGLFTPVEPVYEDVTDQVSTDPMGNSLGTTYDQTNTIEKKIPPSELPNKPDWMAASSMVYEALNNKPFDGSPEELADYGVQVAQFFGNNLTLGAIPLAYSVAKMPQDKRQAFLYLLDTYDRVGLPPENAARALGYQATDISNIVSVGSILATLGADAPVVAAGKAVTVNTLKQIIRNPAFIAGFDNLVSGAGYDLTKQSVEVSAGRKDSIDLGQTAEVAGIQGAVGTVLGKALGLTGKFFAREATPNVTIPRIEPDFIPKPQTTPEMDKIVSTFEQGLKEELAKESLSPELQDIVNQFGDDVARSLEGADTLEQKAQRSLEQFTTSHAEKAANDNEAAIVASNTDRVDSIKDQIDGIDTQTRQTINDNTPHQPEVSDRVKELMDRVPDFSTYTVDQVRDAVKPILDEFLDIAQQGPEELERALSYRLIEPERNKLMAIVTRAAAQVENEIVSIGDQLDVLVNQPVTDALAIERLEAQRTSALDTLANIQKLQTPIGSEAGRLLKLAQIDAALPASVRPDVSKLRASGVSEDDIARMIADASDSVSKKELYGLYAERDAAKAAGDLTEVAKIDSKIDQVYDKVKLAADAAKDSFMKKLVGIVVEMRTTSLISSTGTIVRNVVGGGLHKILDRSSEIIGLLGLPDGYKYIAAQRVGRGIAMKAGFSGQLSALSNLLKNSIKEAVNERSLINVNDLRLGENNVRKITSTSLGLDPNSATGRTVDIAGRVWRAQTIPMVVSDEMLGGIFARAEIGEQAGFEFVKLLARKREVLQAKLRDPNIDAVRRRGYQSELKELKNVKTAKVNGQSLADFVEKRVASVIDASGRITDEAVLERVNYLLLRNSPTGTISKGVESFANMGGGAVRLIQPFVRTPINEFKRTLEYIPLTQNMKFMHDLGTDLASKDPRVAARARGKFIVGWAVTATALYAAYEGISTGSAPKSKDDRLTNEAAGVMAPKSLNMFGFESDISGLGPLTNVFIFAANMVRDSESQWREIDNLVAIGDQEGAAKKIEESDQYKQKAQAVLFAYLAAIGNAILDTSTLEGPKSIIDSANTLIKSADDNETLGKAFDKQGERYATSMIPAFIKEASNVIDPTKVDPNGIIEALKASLGIKENQAVIRDALGYPIENKTPYRAMIGPFGPQNIKEADNTAQIVRNNLEYLRQMTGRSFILETSPPEVGKLDLTKIKASKSGRTMYDAYADNLQTIRLAGTGGRSQTLAEALYEVIGSKDTLNLSVGNSEYKGKLFEYISQVMNRYKTAAWYKTKNEERANADFVTEFNWRYDLKNSAQNPRMDIAPPSIRLPFQ